MVRSAVLACALLLAGAEASAQHIFLVRHAERADTAGGTPAVSGSDPDLSEAGRARAQSLAAVLQDAGIVAIFVTEYKRTQQTAAPLATLLGLAPTVIAAKDVPSLATRLRELEGSALVVGHSNSIPGVIAALGLPAVTIADAEYDNLFVVTDSRKLIRLRLP